MIRHHKFQAIISVFVITVLMYSCNNLEQNKSDLKLQDEQTEAGLILAINRLIRPDDDFSIATLDSIYHDNMVVIMTDENDNKNIFHEKAFKELIASKLEGEERNNNNT